MPIATEDSGVSRVAGVGEVGAVRGRAEDEAEGYLEARLSVICRIGRRSDSVIDLERPLNAGDGGVPKYGGRDVAGTRLSSNGEREPKGSALADSDVNDDCESAKRLLLPCAEDGEVTGLDWALRLRGDG